MQLDNLASIDSTTKAGKKKSTKLDQMNQRLNWQDRTTADEPKGVKTAATLMWKDWQRISHVKPEKPY